MSDSEIIDALGGTHKVAELCDTTPQAVSQWRDNGIPRDRRQFLALVRPDVVTYKPKYGSGALTRKVA